MARDLRLNVDSDASGARRGLDETARSVDHLGDETRRLQREFNEASRAASKLDRQLLETRAAAAALGREFAKTQDRSLLAQIQAHTKAATEIKRVQATIVGDSETRAKQSAKAWRNAFDDLQNMASSAGGAAFQAGGGIFGTLAKNPALAAGAATVAIPATIGIGATVGGVVGAGVGAGLAGLSVAGAAAQSEAVHRAWSTEIAAIKKEFLQATEPSIEPTIAAVHQLGEAVRNVHFDAIFGESAKFIEPLSKGLAKGIEGFGKGVEKFVTNAAPYVAALADSFAMLGKGAGDALDAIGDGSEGGARALRDFAAATTGVIVGTGRFIGLLEDAYNEVDKLGGKITQYHPVAKQFADIFGKGEPVVVSRQLDLKRLAEEAAEAASGFADMRSQVVLANDAFAGLFGTLMGVDQANLAVKLGMADLTKAAKDHNVTQDELTQKVLQQIQALQDQRQAQLNTGDSSQAATDKINANYNAQLDALKKLFPALAELIDKYEQLAKPLVKHIDIIISEKRIGSVSVEGVISGGDQRRNAGKAYATGVRNAPPGWALVGETGRPELIHFKGGEDVYNPADTAALMRGWTTAPSTVGMAQAAGASGGSSSMGSRPVTVNFAGAPTSGIDGLFASWFMKMVRTGQIRITG